MSVVARDALASLGLAGHASTVNAPSSVASRAGLWPYLRDQRGAIARLAVRHVELVALSLLIAIAIALPLGLVLERAARRRGGVHTIGWRAPDAARNRAARVHDSVVWHRRGAGARRARFVFALSHRAQHLHRSSRRRSGRGVGGARARNDRRPDLREVRLPLATPVIMAGVRTAAVIDVGTATLAAFIGAGGLGEPIVAGLALSDTRMILSGAIPAALLAIAVDAGLAIVERWTRPGHS